MYKNQSNGAARFFLSLPGRAGQLLAACNDLITSLLLYHWATAAPRTFFNNIIDYRGHHWKGIKIYDKNIRDNDLDEQV